MIYLDNAATSWPKPPAVLEAMTNSLERDGGNPGRSGHRLSIAAARLIYDTRERLADFFGAPDPLRVVFTANATQSVNLVLMGMLRAGDHVVTTSMEHNSVMRPLRALERKGIQVRTVPCAADGTIHISDVAAAMKPSTRLVVTTHASNVVGTLLPAAEIASIAHKSGALLLVDAAQTAGAVPLNMETMGIDLLAFTGHKELQGPPGVGGLVIGGRVDVSQMEPLVRGGTGSRSELEEQPDDLPDKFEGGTANLTGIAGLGAGVKWIADRGVDGVRAHMTRLTRSLIDGLSAIPQVTLLGTLDPERSVAVVSFTVAGRHVSEIGMRLDEEYGVLSRVGLHCAPAAHRTIGTFPEGTVRLAPGVFTTERDIEEALQAIAGVLRS